MRKVDDVKNYKCIQCDISFKTSEDLKYHLDETHKPQKSAPSRKVYSHQEKKQNGYCRFWNHYNCTFEKHCKFLHDEAPHCRFQDRCRAKPMCQFYHEELHQQSHFLGPRRSQGHLKQTAWTNTPRNRKSF